MNDDRYLTTEEASQYCRASVNTFKKWISKYRIPFHRPGHRLLFLKADLDRFLKTRRTTAA